MDTKMVTDGTLQSYTAIHTYQDGYRWYCTILYSYTHMDTKMVTDGTLQSYTAIHTYQDCYRWNFTILYSYTHIPRWLQIRAGNSLIRSSLICSFCSNQMSDCERFAQITQDKWAIMSELLRSLKGNERPWAICSGRSGEMSNVSKSLISLTKNEQMSDSLKKCCPKKSKILFYYVLFKV